MTMMKRNHILTAAVLLGTVVACQKEFSFIEDPLPVEPPVFTIEASVDVDETRAFLDETGDIFWNSGDALAVFQGSKAEPYRFATEEQGLSCRFTYNGELDAAGGPFLALYPFNADARQAAGAITTTLPTEQMAAPGSFGEDANLAVAYAPFGQKMSFRNAAAYAKVSFKTSDEAAAITKITVRSIDETVLLSGPVTLTPTIEAEAVKDVALTVSAEGGVPYASVVAPEGTTLLPETDYYIALAPAALKSGYRIELTTSAGLTFTKDYTGGAYNSATFKRNTIAPVGRKNLDKFEMEGWWRVRNADLDKANHPGVGNYLVVKKMDDGSYRVLNDEGSDTYLVKSGQEGATQYNSFQLSGSYMSGLSEPPENLKPYKQKQMEAIVAYVFRNAFISSSDASNNIKATDEVIVCPNNIGIEVKSYKLGRDYYFYANITLYNRFDNTQIITTLDELACTLNTLDEGFLTGRFNTKSASTNPDGNPNTCSDLVEALLAHAVFEKKLFFDPNPIIRDAATDAIQGTDNKFTEGGFSSKVYSNAYTPMGTGMNYSNHFMIKTEDLLSGAETSTIALYKKGTKMYGDYIN